MTASSASGGSSLPWLFSRNIDLWTFGGSALLSLLLLAMGAPLGLLEGSSPEWTWITCVLLIDVAHVYATGFRVYFDREELRRRPVLYYGTPIVAFAVGWAICSESEMLFWRIIAYLAVFHFVRQQFGWVMLYRARAGETGLWSRRFDAAVITMATVHPLVVWHSRLPRQFVWMREGDFLTIPAGSLDWLPVISGVIWGTLLIAAVARSLWMGFRHAHWNPGKDLVIATTALCWYIGIVAFDSDYAFTVTNVIIHGIPYGVLVYWHWRQTAKSRGRTVRHPLFVFLGAIWLLAYAEELLWDRGVWQDRGFLFGGDWNLPIPSSVLAPLLAVPQLTHYLLDGFIWKRKHNPSVDQALTIKSSPETTTG